MTFRNLKWGLRVLGAETGSSHGESLSRTDLLLAIIMPPDVGSA